VSPLPIVLPFVLNTQKLTNIQRTTAVAAKTALLRAASGLGRLSEAGTKFMPFWDP
jgi:hypothetical protein